MKIKLLITILSILFLNVLSANASELPKDVKDYLFEQKVVPTVRFDSLVIYNKEIMYLPVYPAYPQEVEEVEIDKRNLREFSVKKLSSGVFEVTGELVFEIMKRVNLDDMVSNAYFQKRIKNDGIIDALLEIGLQEGDMIHIGDYELQYFE